MFGLIAVVWSFFYRVPLGLNWRLEVDSGRSFNRAKRICYVIAYVYYRIFTFYYSAKRFTQRLFHRLRPSKQRYDQTFRYPQVHLTPSWREIRLLQLQPGSPSAPLVGTLFSRPIITIWLWSFQFDVPAYDALSYCWGVNPPSVPILLSGNLLLITPSLAAALRKLRLPDRPRYLWTDYICIDQHSTAEKNIYVPRMGEIYTNASTVVIWLGEHTNSSRVLFSALDDVDDASAENSGMYFMRELQPGAPIHESVVAALRKALKSTAGRELCLQFLEANFADIDLPGFGVHERRLMMELYLDIEDRANIEWKVFISMFEEILASPWFGRMWTVQEPVLARELIVHIGDSPAVPWRRFVGALRIVMTIMRAEVSSFPSGGNQALEVVEMLRHTWYSLDGPKQNIREILEACRPRQATNVRDKVYALLGLYGSWTIPRMPAGGSPADEDNLGEIVADSAFYTHHRAGKGPDVPVVDYNNSEEQVFLETALTCMAAGSLRVLKDCCALAEIPPVGTEIISPYHGRYHTRSAGLGRPLPSWVTDWSMDAVTECRSPIVDDIRDIDERYHAAKDTEPDFRVLLEAKSATSPADPCSTAILAVTGLLFSRVIEVSESTHTYANLDSSLSQSVWADWYRIAMCDAESSPYRSIDGCREALWRTLVLDAAGAHSKARASEETGEGFHQALVNMIIGGTLPAKVEAHIARNGRLCFVDYNTRQSSWAYPRSSAGEEETGPLPPGWEERMTDGEKIYYVDHNTQTTTWEHPGKPKKSASADASEESRAKIVAPISPEEFELWSKNLRNWLDDHDNRHRNKRLFRTEDGYLGMSCTHVQAGDMVSILWGGRLPFLLRPCSKIKLIERKIGREYETISSNDAAGTSEGNAIAITYQLIGGECYVHGLADGEALDVAKEKGLQPAALYIR